MFAFSRCLLNTSRQYSELALQLLFSIRQVLKKDAGEHENQQFNPAAGDTT